jgi:hypothetical protein
VLGEQYGNRVVDIENSEYETLINMLVQQKVDALIVWPNIIADLKPENGKSIQLTSFAFSEKLANSLITYIGCHNDIMGQRLITQLNQILDDKNHQKAIFSPLIERMDKNSVSFYKEKLGLEF